MSKIIRVLQFSPNYEVCGVSKYQENFMDVFAKKPDVIKSDFFKTSPYQTRLMKQDELDMVLQKLRTELRNYDILHIQHEFGLFSGNEFAQIIDVAKSMHKKVVVTIHLSPALAFKHKPRTGIGPRSVLNLVRQKRLHHIFKQRHIFPLRHADLVISHNKGTTLSLMAYGIKKDNILQYNHPVMGITKPKVTSTEIADKLNKQANDVIYSTVGFLHKFKGTEDAIRALKYLPENYKLAIIGGMQPISSEVKFYNKIATLIDTLNLKSRVYITGFVEDDDRLNALIRETDMSVYPYSNVYYGQVSSGALNLAFANERAVISYPTDGFKDINQEFGQIVFCDTFGYYELAREIIRIDTPKQVAAGKKYAAAYSWPKTADVLIRAYQKLV